MKIWLHPYQLEARAEKQKSREGVLVKVEWTPGQVGYSDLHPWPEFGEPNIEAQIQDLANLKMSPLVERSLDFNYIDQQFRHLKRNAFLGLLLPRAHKLIFDIKTVTRGELERYVEQGFTHIKVKMGRDLEAETKCLNELVNGTDLLWRLDFNGRISQTEFTAWWTSLAPALKKRLDFIEDPIASGSLAIDGPWARDWSPVAHAKVRILKPAREIDEDSAGYQRTVFTHSLEHTYGQACSLWAAARFYTARPKRLEVCGLGHTDVYKLDEFSKAWSCVGPRMKPTSGFGFGFDELLAGLNWDRLL